MATILTETIKDNRTTNLMDAFNHSQAIHSMRESIRIASVGATIIQSWFIDKRQMQVCKCIIEDNENVNWIHTMEDKAIDITCNADEGKAKLDLE